ncbi:MAG: hypothetical protein P8R02_03765 [Pseudomonadales bacterium]|nr:hypothetical protein [Pseudomonadales bacterium]
MSEDTPDLLSKARVIHDDTLCLDAHADIVTTKTSPQFLSKGGASKVAPEKMREGGLNSVVLALAVGPGSRSERGVKFAREQMQLQHATVLQLLEADKSIA